MDGWDAVWGLGIQIGEPPKKGDLAEDRFIMKNTRCCDARLFQLYLSQ